MNARTAMDYRSLLNSRDAVAELLQVGLNARATRQMGGPDSHERNAGAFQNRGDLGSKARVTAHDQRLVELRSLIGFALRDGSKAIDVPVCPGADERIESR